MKREKMEDRKLEFYISQLQTYQKTLWAYHYADGLLDYDSLTSMPTGGMKDRGEARALLTGEIYNIQADPQTGEMLDVLTEAEAELDMQTLREVQDLRKNAGLRKFD